MTVVPVGGFGYEEKVRVTVIYGDSCEANQFFGRFLENIFART